MRIYRNWHSYLGDTWATFQLLAYWAKWRREPILLSTNQHGHNLRPMQEEIMDVLDLSGHGEIVLVDEEPNIDFTGFEVWAAAVLPTKIRWELNPHHKIITYQFDGISTPEKNPPPDDIDKMLAWIESKGFTPVRVGKDTSLKGCIHLMSKSVLFVGSDSGMSHIAHSVGVPVYLMEYKLGLATCHRGRQYVQCKGADSFISQAENYLTFINSLVIK